MEGWIKLYRNITRSPLFDNPKLLKVWVWCMSNAAYAQHDVIVGKKTITLNPGEFITGRKKAAIELNMAEGTVYDYLHLLEKRGNITLIPNNKYTVVRVEKWGIYQSEDDIPNNKMSSKVSTQISSKISSKVYTTKEEKEKREDIEEKKNILITDSNESVRQTEKASDVPTLTETEAMSAANDVSGKRGFPEELKKAFNRWITYKYTRGDAFKNYYAVDKVGQAIESHSKDYAGRVNERSTNQVVKLLIIALRQIQRVFVGHRFIAFNERRAQSE